MCIIQELKIKCNFRIWSELRMDTMFRCVSSNKKRRQNNDGCEGICAPKKRRKGKPLRKNMQPLGEIARREEQR
jgi:hypothetical protein